MSNNLTDQALKLHNRIAALYVQERVNVGPDRQFNGDFERLARLDRLKRATFDRWKRRRERELIAA